MLCLLGFLCLELLAVRSDASDFFHAGPLFDEFDLTLSLGTRTEAVGPFYYQQQKESEHIWAIPPLLSSTTDPETDLAEFDFVYPILTYDRYGSEGRCCDQYTQVGHRVTSSYKAKQMGPTSVYPSQLAYTSS